MPNRNSLTDSLIRSLFINISCTSSFFTCVYFKVQSNIIFNLQAINRPQDISISNIRKQSQWANTLKLGVTDATRYSRDQDVIPWDLLAEIDFFVLSYSLTLS